MMELRLGSSGKKDVEDEPTKGNLAGGCCFDFNKVGHNMKGYIAVLLYGSRTKPPAYLIMHVCMYVFGRTHIFCLDFDCFGGVS